MDDRYSEHRYDMQSYPRTPESRIFSDNDGETRDYKAAIKMKKPKGNSEMLAIENIAEPDNKKSIRV